jgi:hypothetical protein
MLTRVYGRKKGHQFDRAVRPHPITGAKLVGFRLPRWSEVVDLAKRAAAACPESPLVGADIAITDTELRVIEIQPDWESNIAQLTYGAGLRPLLREVVPRLTAPDGIRQQALRCMVLVGHTRRWRKPPRHAREPEGTQSLEQPTHG